LDSDRSISLSNNSIILSNGLGTPEGIAVDWLADRLYLVDSKLDHVEVSDLDGQNRVVLITGGFSNPRALSLDARYG